MNFKKKIIAIVFLAFFSATVLLSCGKQSNQAEQTMGEQSDSTEHPSDSTEHPSDSTEHPSEHPSDSTKN
jgi:hypothetical protein